jgi:hypothetical protein
MSSSTDRRAEEAAAIMRASRAWTDHSFGPPPNDVKAVKGPRDRGKSVVLSLGRVGPGGRPIVAKELLSEAARVETAVYRDILPRLPAIHGPEFIGWVGSVEPHRVWLFLEQIQGPPLDKTDPSHVAIASRWLGRLHSGTLLEEFHGLLPDRGPDHYLTMAVRTFSGLKEVSENPALGRVEIDVLARLSAQLSMILDSYDSFADVYTHLPAAVVHGDFKGNNMAFSGAIGLENLRVFDWSESHYGPLAVDMWWVDSDAYREALNVNGLAHDRATIEEWRRFSAVMRWLSAISWEIPRLRYEWVERPMRRMTLYEGRLGSALRDSAWAR